MDTASIIVICFLLYLIFTTVLSALFFSKNKKLKILNKKYSPIISVEKQVEEARAKSVKQIKQMINDKNEASKMLTDINKLLADKQKELKNIKLDLANITDEHQLNLDGFKPAVFELDDHAEYVIAIKILKERQKDLIRRKEAVVCPIDWTVGDSRREGKKAVGRMIRLTLRAFNNECDLMIKNLTWKNAERTKDKIYRLAEILDDLNESMQISITNEFIDLKIKEVDLNNAEKLKKEEEKERLRTQRELEREEAKAQREYYAEVKRQENLERKKQDALLAARERLSIASEEHRNAIENEIKTIEAELSEAIMQKGRLLSMAQQTRIGHVYIISNRGSFGERMVKIGMTRRLEPMDRVKELGDASVPFPFDVHAIIFSEDAPKLERELHDIFSSKRVNKVNNRKEFFSIDINDLEVKIHEKIPDIPFDKNAASMEYTQSLLEAS